MDLGKSPQVRFRRLEKENNRAGTGIPHGTANGVNNKIVASKFFADSLLSFGIF